TTVFYWPSLRTNLERPDLPIKSMYVGNDNTWGTSVETRWYLARLLGLQEPEGTESTLALDYFGKRGFGGGVETRYTGEQYLGRVLGYIIHDSGEDRLGRDSSRKNLEPPRELRGRFRWQHRQYLPYNWQLTSEVSYLSDENFLEGYYRSEFNVGKEQETLVHLKRIEDNWGLAFLGKVRINDFVDQLEELPTAEFHWTGQSFFDDKLTFYSDTQASRFRQRFASSNPTPGSEDFYTFTTTRNEIDMPLVVGKAKVVPFVAGTVAYDDGMGFYRELNGGTATRQDGVWFGETGVRVSTNPYWKVFPGVKSELWDRGIWISCGTL
ncbi:MAG: LPS assembly protein LptD, partial [Planctomycetota bacterium]